MPPPPAPTPSDVETVVVGAGPAGAATAIALRRLGRDVVLLDRARFPRDKVCGDVLLPEALENLSALGLNLAPLESRAFRCTGARYVAPDGDEVFGDFSDVDGARRPWWMIKREVFDAWLLEQARDAGVSVQEGVSVREVRRDGGEQVTGVVLGSPDRASGEIAARVVVGADGASSVVARSVGAFATEPKHTCLAIRAYATDLALPRPHLEIFTTRDTLPGCAWIAPVGPSEANVGLGILKSTSLERHMTPKALFAEVSRQVPFLASRLSTARLGPLRGWSLPGAAARRKLSGPGWLLVGDAGAMVDPFTGHGIHHALHAGRLAAQAIDGALADRDASAESLRRYDALCTAAFSTEVTYGAWLQRAHASPSVSRLAAWACRRHAGLRQTFLALVGHSAQRRQLLAPSALIGAAFRRRPQLQVES